ncbi:MAG: hypothetical protein ABL934_10485 [Lysobacteraceae bacterium]
MTPRNIQKAILFVATTTALQGLSVCAHADNLSYATSDIKSVQVWRLDGNDEEADVDKDNEFVRHCDGSGKALLYVGSLREPVRCAATSLHSGDYRIRIDGLGQKLPRLAVVSLRPLPERVLPSAPNETELITLIAAEKSLQIETATSLQRDFIQTYGGTAEQYQQQLASTQASAKYLAKVGQRWKLALPQSAVLVSPLGAVLDPMGWDMEYAVHLSGPAGLTLIGRFRGCVEGFRDVNGDGVADVFTATCENDEGLSYAFVSVAGTVQRLMSH